MCCLTPDRGATAPVGGLYGIKNGACRRYAYRVSYGTQEAQFTPYTRTSGTPDFIVALMPPTVAVAPMSGVISRRVPSARRVYMVL